MIKHTMLVAFTDPIDDNDLDRYLADIEGAMSATGVVRDFSSARHIAVPGESAIPAFIATAVLEFAVESRGDLATLFAAPGAGEVIHKWQATNPYKVAWVNHEIHA
jgi:hypothetical protein